MQLEGDRQLDAQIKVTPPSRSYTGTVLLAIPAQSIGQFTLDNPIKSEGFREEPAYISQKPWLVNVSDAIRNTRRISLLQLKLVVHAHRKTSNLQRAKSIRSKELG